MQSQNNLATPTSKNGISFSRLVNAESHKNFNELIKCKICFNILNNPYDCSKCGNSFCYNCISQLVNENKPCPFKCEQYSIKPSSFSIMSYLAKLSFTCLNKANGCNDIIPYSNVVDHDKNCKFFYTKCPNVQCSMKLKWTLIESHLKNECPFTLFKCDKCGIDFYRDDINEHVKNCNSIMNSLNYSINTNDNTKYINDFDTVMKGLPEIKDATMLSFMKAIMYQINVNNMKLNAKFDAMKSEMNGIHEDIDKVCKNNMIFFESINTELENINTKIANSQQHSIDDNQNETLTTLTNEDGKKTSSNNSNNNSILSEHQSVNSSRRVKFSPRLETSEDNINVHNSAITPSHNNKTKSKDNTTHKRVKTLPINKSTFTKSYSPKNVSSSNSNPPSNEKTSYYRPFNTFSSYTNSNLVNIINNQEIIISKLTALEKKCDEGNDKLLREIKESELKQISLMKEKLFDEGINHEMLRKDELINVVDEIKEAKVEEEDNSESNV